MVKCTCLPTIPACVYQSQTRVETSIILHPHHVKYHLHCNRGVVVVMAAVTASARTQTVATFVQPKLEKKSVSTVKAIGAKAQNVRVSCSVEKDVRSFVKKCADASKVASIALAASVLLASGAEAATKRFTFEELQSQTYSELKGTGLANQCPVLSEGADGLAIPAGAYKLQKFCMEPTAFTVKSESGFKNEGDAFQKVKLMTRLTYTLDEMEGAFNIGADGNVTMTETDGIDYAAVTVQLPGGERVPFLFTVKELSASGKADAFSGPFVVPSYRGSTFLDPKGRGGSTGYDNAVALPAGGAGDEEELAKENSKNTAALEGNVVFSVAKSNTETGEVAGVFRSIQPSDTDLGSKAPKDVKIDGIWYAQLS